MVFFLVTDTPTNLTYIRTPTLLTWSPPVNDIPVFFNISNGTRVNMETNTTELNITSIQPNVNYTSFVVAYEGDLPSDIS